MPAVYLGSWLCNPLTIPPMLYIDYELGAWLLGGADVGQEKFADITFRTLLTLGWDVLAPMILGGAILGTISALAAYYPIKRAVIRVRQGLHHQQPGPPP
jgi:uncharacterized protein (DUF2062 family)